MIEKYNIGSYLYPPSSSWCKLNFQRASIAHGVVNVISQALLHY